MQGMSTLLALPVLRTEEPETLLYNLAYARNLSR